MVQHMVARASASVFVGNDLVENELLIDAFKKMVLEVGSEITRKPLLELFPRLLKFRMWYIGKTSTKVRKVRNQLYTALRPEIDIRLNNMKLEGSNWERPVSIKKKMIIPTLFFIYKFIFFTYFFFLNKIGRYFTEYY